MFRNGAELIKQANHQNKKISDIMIEQEIQVTGRTKEEILSIMERNLEVMEKAVERGINGVYSPTGLTGGDAVLMQKYIEKGKLLSGEMVLDAVSKAMATN